MDYVNERSSAFLGHKRDFSDFLELDVQRARLLQVASSNTRRFIVQLAELRAFNRGIAERFLMYPTQFWPAWTAALKEAMRGIEAPPREDKAKDADLAWLLGVEGDFGARRVSPRQLQAHHLGQLMCLEGIVTKVSLIRPKVERTIHFCEATGAYTEREYYDHTSLSGQYRSAGSAYPQKDAAGNALTTEFGLSSYGDHQTLSIQEMPERSPAGLLPSSVEVILDHDLVDRAKPGDRIQIVGVFRALPSKHNAEGSGVFKAVLIAASLRAITKNRASDAQQLSDQDVMTIRQQSNRPDIFDCLARSIAPSIYGHANIKRALTLLLLGGMEKNLPNGAHIRGDINLLMVGDPSTAKSQLLRFVLAIAPLAINTTGRGSSGVGLTAAVVADRETGDRRLEAGAMVLADRGIVCIDEFDKMSDADRVAIHEVMEQQTVTIAKAGIHMSLNARCSVVAAANPRYSQYDKNKTPAFNVNLPDSLLSRFDLLFIVLDEPDAQTDRLIADRVLTNHRLGSNALSSNQSDECSLQNRGDSNDDGAEMDAMESESSSAFQPRRVDDVNGDDQVVYSTQFLRKYFAFAKDMCTPVLTDEAAELISSKYTELRTSQAQKQNGYPITARCLETLIRLSTAHAKARLDVNNEVLVEDVDAALDVLESAIEGSRDTKASERERRRQERAHAADSDGNNSDDTDDDDSRGPPRRRTLQEEDEQKEKQHADREIVSEQKMDDDEEDHQQLSPARSRSTRNQARQAASDENPTQRKRSRISSHSSSTAQLSGAVQDASSLTQESSSSSSSSARSSVLDYDSARGKLFKTLSTRALRYEPIQDVSAVLAYFNSNLPAQAEEFDMNELVQWVKDAGDGAVFYDEDAQTLFRG